MTMKRVLITGAGGIAGVNFSRAISLDKSLELFGTENNEYHTIFNPIKFFKIPNANDPNYINQLNNIIKSNQISFLHPQPTPEIQKIVQNIEKISTRTFLPSSDIVLRDKSEQQSLLLKKGQKVTKTFLVSKLSDVDQIIDQIKFPVWVRAKKGVGGRLSNKCNSIKEIKLWIELCVLQGRAMLNEFIIQEYHGGRDLAWDSLWYDGKLIVSYSRERLEYPFAKLTMSGITGTPTIARIIHDDKINKLGIESVRMMSSKPHGCFSLDIKEDLDNTPYITEIDSGKFHTTIGLWGFLAEKNLQLDWYTNIPRLYVHLGTDGDIPVTNQMDIYPEDLYLIRNLDCGAWIRLNNKKEKVI